MAFEAAAGANVGAAEGRCLIIGFGKTPEASLKVRPVIPPHPTPPPLYVMGRMLTSSFGARLFRTRSQIRVIAEATGGWVLAGSMTTAAAPGESVAASASAVYRSTTGAVGTYFSFCRGPTNVVGGDHVDTKNAQRFLVARCVIRLCFWNRCFRRSSCVPAPTAAAAARAWGGAGPYKVC